MTHVEGMFSRVGGCFCSLAREQGIERERERERGEASGRILIFGGLRMRERTREQWKKEREHIGGAPCPAGLCRRRGVLTGMK